jgi:uncharacterized protein with HEPN domain
MSRHDPRVTLHQIQDAAGRLQAICTGRDLDNLVSDWQATAALERFIEVLGEAVKRLPLDLRSRYPAVPWKEIAGTRDHLSHGYDDLDYQILWDAVQKDILCCWPQSSKCSATWNRTPKPQSAMDPVPGVRFSPARGRYARCARSIP